ncbi:hypothetical protein ACFFLM_15355 [Deinococcus oregonensis]|uniref:Uncharacterized protein n=1 Tax=Deinococcus oregonensis TaxID=1805970 RepID=A0ABV6B0T9_9DEIO
MKKLLMLGTLLLSTAGANSLSANLPAGAVATLETQNFSPTYARVMQVLEDLLGNLPEPLSDVASTLEELGPLLNNSFNNEATVGLFTVGDAKTGFDLHYLIAVRTKGDAKKLFIEDGLMGVPKATARIGQYGLARDGDSFSGQQGDLLYTSDNKALLMNYLGKLSGKAGPRLASSPAYSLATRQAGTQELSAFLNFSAAAKLVRGAFGKEIGLPRLLSPVVDAVDTLGQWRGGLSSTASGLKTSSAHTVNPEGKDASLRTLLTHTRDNFEIGRLIPADASAVSVNACHSGTGAYLGRWLTRFDLLEPTGFLSDTQLAAELEMQSRYLGDECAQITARGVQPSKTTSAGLLSSLVSTVSIQSVTDEALARRQMDGLTRSVNAALRSSLTQVYGLANGFGDSGSEQETAIFAPLLSMLDPKQLDEVSMRHAFKDGYLITAFSQAALDQVLNAPETLQDNAQFNALKGNAGVTWSPKPSEAFTAESLLEKIQTQLSGNPAAGLLADPEMQEMAGPALDAFAGVLNRYGGAWSRTNVTGNSRITQGEVQFDWN